MAKLVRHDRETGPRSQLAELELKLRPGLAECVLAPAATPDQLQKFLGDEIALNDDTLVVPRFGSEQGLPAEDGAVKLSSKPENDFPLTELHVANSKAVEVLHAKKSVELQECL